MTTGGTGRKRGDEMDLRRATGLLNKRYVKGRVLVYAYTPAGWESVMKGNPHLLEEFAKQTDQGATIPFRYSCAL